MVRIRLQRRGRRKRPIHHVVVADSRAPRDGRIIEDLGRFNNLATQNEVDLNEERTIHWLKQGAQPSDTVRSILRHQGILYKMHLIRWDKSEEEIEEALAEWRENREIKQGKQAATAKQEQKAMLDAEEKEYQKRLKEKAEKAAKEREKQKILDEAEAKEKEEKQAEAEKAKAVEEPEEISEKQEEPAEKAEETEKPAEAVAEAEESKESAKESEDAPGETSDAEVKEEESAAAEEAAKAPEGEQEQVSTDMLAKEAISHIEETSIEELKGFVPDNESRVTVKRAWEEKQEG